MRRPRSAFATLHAGGHRVGNDDGDLLRRRRQINEVGVLPNRTRVTLSRALSAGHLVHPRQRKCLIHGDHSG